MCGLCGSFGGWHWAHAGRDAEALRRERGARLRLLNRVLAHYDLAVRPWGGDGYLLSGAGIPNQLADNMTSLWAAVETARGVSCSPLDSSLLESLPAPGMPPR